MPRKREDLTGRKYGRLTIIGYDHTDSHGETYWKCKCECGNPDTVIIRRQSLITGSTKSCGCLFHEPENLVGKKFNRLTVLSFAGRDGENKARWYCRCDCGKETIVDGWNLKSGHVKSCGCFRDELIGDLNRVHGHSKNGESIYPVWKSMRARCNNPKNHAYKNYGGRGITVCNEWDEDFKSFYDWAMDNGYKPNLSIDRIDNDKGYCPDNCRWATRIEQSNNRRMCRHIIYNEVDHTIAEWSRILNVPYRNLRERINRGDMQDFERYFSKINEED